MLNEDKNKCVVLYTFIKTIYTLAFQNNINHGQMKSVLKSLLKYPVKKAKNPKDIGFDTEKVCSLNESVRENTTFV